MEFEFQKEEEVCNAPCIEKNSSAFSKLSQLLTSLKTELRRPSTAVLCVLIISLSIGYLDFSAIKDKIPYRIPYKLPYGISYGRKLNTVNTGNGTFWTDTRHIKASEELYQVWSQMYGLENKIPPSQIFPPEEGWGAEDNPLPLPRPPHLQDCVSLSERRRVMEERGPNGEDPSWLEDKGSGPKPPWIRGSDDSLLPHTRSLQSLLWLSQHPSGCHSLDLSLKFAVVQWGNPITHGMGSALHIMSQVMGFMREGGRVLVPDSNFERAKHRFCEGDDYANFECYFFPLTDPKCKKMALEILAGQSEEEQMENLDLKARIASNTRVIKISNLWLPWYNMWSPPNLDKPWLENDMSVEVFGKVPKIKESQEWGQWGPENGIWEEFVKAGWWRAQCIRYFLRFPAKNMCHAINQLRHEVYGMETARGVVESLKHQRFAVKQSSILDSKEGEMLGEIKLGSDTFENGIWKDAEPYIPRPIVSVHVRQSDKESEMHIFTMGAYMWEAARLKQHIPNLQNVWLTTETKKVIEQSHKYNGWKFFHGKHEGKGRFAENEEDMDFDKVVKEVFANWLVASECDGFVGPLASNFYRVINELRLTNGRLKAGVLAVNFDEC